MQRYRHYGASYSPPPRVPAPPVEEVQAKEEEVEEEEELVEEEEVLEEAELVYAEEEEPLIEEVQEEEESGGVPEQEVGQTVVTETEGKAPQSESKNGRRSEAGGGAGGDAAAAGGGGGEGGGAKYSVFTWLVVLALLGVWSSVAVVYFDVVDYDSVLGKLMAYDADGDGDFDVEDAKVLLGLKAARTPDGGAPSQESPGEEPEPGQSERTRPEPPTIESTQPLENPTEEPKPESGPQDVDSEIQAAVPLPPFVEDDFVPDNPPESVRHDEERFSIDTTGVLVEEPPSWEETGAAADPVVTSSTLTQEAAAEKQLEEKQLEEKQLEEKQLEEKQLEEKQLEEKQLEEKQLEEKQLEEKQTEEKQLEEKQLEEKQLEEKQLEEKQLEEKQLEEKQLEEKQLEEKQLEEKQTEEKQLEEKQLEEKQTEEKQPEKAKKKKTKLLNKLDKTIKAEIDAAERLRKKGKVEDGLRAFQALVEQHPLSPRARYGKAQCEDDLAERLRSNDLLQKAISSYREAAELPEVTPDLQRAALRRRAERQQFLGRMRGSLVTLEKLVQIFPEDIGLKNDLGVAHLLLGDNKGAKKVYEEILQVAPDNGFAKVHYGFILKTDNQIAESIPYLKEGLESGEPGTDDGRFYFHLGDALQRVGDDSAYEWYERGHSRGHFASVWQRSLYNVKGLKAQPWWTPRETGYGDLVKMLERNWKTIRDEALAVMDRETGLFVPEEENLREKGEWGQYTLWQQGRKVGNSCQGAPKTCSLLERFPEATGCKRGQIKYSVMQPGTHVWPHTGPTNCRLRLHLGLVIPKPGCRIRCTNQTRTWEEGKVLIFDDSFEHEVWQDASSYRLIFIVDVWHPELTQYQRQTLSPI